MPRNKMMDMVPPEGGRSIRNIPLPESKKKSVKTAEIETVREVHQEFTRIRSEKPRNWKMYMYVGGGVAIVLLGIIVSNIFHSAKVSVTPRTLVADINTNLSAKKNAGGADLPFIPLSISKEGSVTVKASGEEQVDKKASGTIVVFNDYSSASQRLIKNTRFETPEGLIYRIDQSITVPGKKNGIPGSVEAIVYADETGEKYNAGLKDFTIPGFKGDPRYSSFSAKSKPSAPLAGGFSGVMKVVSDADRKSAQAEIEKGLKAELLKEAEASLSGDSVLFDNAYLITFMPLPQENLANNQVTIKEEGTISGFVFNKETLSSFVARSTIKDYKNEPILIENISDLSFSPKKEIHPATDSDIAFTLSGNAHFVWIYDEEGFKQALSDKSRDEVPAAIKAFPVIEKIDISMSPFWRRSFPSDTSRITILRAE
ncbi:MAG: hypothetical protein COV01_02265 [Candidatus Taylorbacteria bacterium CG10_big_fil_rev_8_21_14_0_10_41_48]|uniref:Baseplate protein J-like domain-containing protein n=1 Tax=Candidatus Taylorbacteria bacterium CG10_big_fil_rev_8_21_14_0_10_41_48 TaxID=1975024 RepID=A0A2M8LCG0_9BACT|nr:MAG: hypothetical protein COV01_02265 [Candidatus Taylorbacteria bacterium CG10_big_fil_rev_8_21_14_0_10_41_48]